MTNEPQFDSDEGRTHFYGDGCDDPHGRMEPQSNSRVVVLRLTGSPDLEGQWREVHQASLQMWRRPTTPLTLPATPITMVATGNVEWNGDRCAEVYVPADKLDEWRAEHDVE